MKALGAFFQPQRKRRRKIDSQSKIRSRRTLLEQLEGRRLLAANAVINEFVFNHNGTDIDEYIEVYSAPSEDLSNYSVVVIDGSGSGTGQISGIFALGTANAGGYQYAGGSVQPGNTFSNGADQSLLLVENNTGLVGDDLDTDDDGTFDVTPWTSIVDDVALNDGNPANLAYSTSVLSPANMNDGITFSVGGASRIANGVDTDSVANWRRNDFDGDGLPSFGLTFTTDTYEATNTPLAANTSSEPTPALTLTETNDSTDVSESGTIDTFFVGLTTNPSSAVTVTVTPDAQLDFGAGAGVAIILIMNDRAPMPVTVSAVDDAIVEAGIHTGLINISTSSSDSSYNNRTASVTANIADNDTPAPLTFLNEFVINHTGADINEFIELRSSANANLSSLTLINIDGDPSAGVGEVLNSDALGVADASGFFAISPVTEYFGGSNIVLVEGFTGNVGTDVDVDDDGTFDWDQSTVPSGGLSAAPWTSIRDAVSVPGAGDESYGFVELSAAALDDGNTFEVGGASRIPDATAVTTASSEWIRNDFAGQGLADYPFFGAESEPGTALNTRGASNSLINGLIVAASGGTTTVAEGGAGDTLELSLGGEIPAFDVTVTITPDAQLDVGAGAGVAITETFTAPSQGPITVTVTANDDLAIEGPHGGVITFSYSSTDPNYSSGSAADVSVTITDNEVGGETPQIIINEIMKNPAQVGDGDGEYVEIYNAGDSTVDLNGWTISDEDFDSHVISGALNIAPGEYLILGRNGNSATNGGVSVDYVYSDFFLGNGGDEVILSTPSGAVIDQVDYNDEFFPDVNGASLELLPAILANPNPELDNNEGTNWQASTTALGTDFGTPGAVNSPSGDTTPPEVTDVIVAGVGGTFAWTPEFIDAVDDGSTGPNNGLGYSVIGTTRTVPWYNVNTIYVQFSEDVNVSGADLFGVEVADYAGNFSVSTVGPLTTITMTSAFGLPETDLGPATSGIDKLLLRLQGSAVTDLAGNALASDFSQQIDVLPGDTNGNGSVNNADVGLTNLRGFLSTTNPGPNGFGFSYDPFYDITANGGINNQDVGLTNFQGFDALPSGTPTPPPLASFAGGVASGPSTDDDSGWTESVDQVFGEGLF